MSHYDDMLRDALASKGYTEPVYLSTKQGIIDTFKQEYGDRQWKRELAAHMSGTRDSKSRAYQSAIRNFQGKREHEKGSKGKWEAIGKSLPPVGTKPTGAAPKKITIKGIQHRGGYQGGLRDRTFNIFLNTGEGHSFMQGPLTIKDLTGTYYGFDMTEDTGGGEGDTSSGSVDIYDIDVE
jgi:hypothetical protein